MRAAVTFAFHFVFRGRVSARDSDATPYYSSMRWELLFHVPALMKCSVPK